jgi:hypothetical protein
MDTTPKTHLHGEPGKTLCGKPSSGELIVPQLPTCDDCATLRVRIDAIKPDSKTPPPGLGNSGRPQSREEVRRAKRRGR